MLAGDIFYAAPLSAQTGANAWLEKGVQAYMTVDFQQAADYLERAVGAGLQDKEKQIRAFQYLAFARAALGDTTQSEAAYLALLALDPDFELPVSASPRLRGPLLSAQKSRARQVNPPPQITLKPVETGRAGRSLTIGAEVKDDTGIDQVRLYYRIQNRGRFTSIPMIRQQGNLYTAEIGGSNVKGPGLEYYVETMNAEGNGPARAGNADSPLLVEVISPDLLPPRITHAPPDTVREGEAVTLTANIRDDHSVKSAAVRFCRTGEPDFQSLRMQKRETGRYQARLPGNAIVPPGILYCIMAVDRAGNRGFWKSEQNPHLLSVTSPPVKQPPLTTDAGGTPVRDQKKGGKKWLWIGLGSAAVIGIVIGFSGGNDGKSGPSTGSITIRVPE